jgi:hypothetical protein
MSATMAPCAEAASAPARTYFFMTGDAAADLLPRVLLPFAKVGLVPYRVHASTEHGAGEEMSLEFRFRGVPRDAAETLAARCRGIVGISSVLTVAEG